MAAAAAVVSRQGPCPYFLFYFGNFILYKKEKRILHTFEESLKIVI